MAEVRRNVGECYIYYVHLYIFQSQKADGFLLVLLNWYYLVRVL